MARLAHGDQLPTANVEWNEEAQHRHLKACVGKRAHTSRPEAKEAMRDYTRRWGKAERNPYAVYLCEFCGFYHWGHRPSPDSPGRKA